jgi:anti-anti-sigma factor
MPATPVEASVRRRAGVAIIDFRGDINGFAEESLSAAYSEAAGEGEGSIVLNFAEVDYINSTGIALIVGLLARARKEGRGVSACGLSDHYREIFEITRLADFMEMFSDEASALAGAPASTS